MNKLNIYKLVFIVILLQLFSCTSQRGERIEFTGGDELYYTDNVTEWEANKLGNFLAQNLFFTGRGITSEINKNNNGFQFRFVVLEGANNDEDYINICKDFAIELSDNVFNKSNVEIHLCDKYLNTLRVVDVKDLIKYRNVEPVDWRTIISLNGDGDKESSFFEISNKPTRLQYKYDTPSPIWGLFILSVIKQGDTEGGTNEIYTQESTSGFSRLSYKQGRYYLKILAGFGNWEVSILEGVYED